MSLPLVKIVTTHDSQPPGLDEATRLWLLVGHDERGRAIIKDENFENKVVEKVQRVRKW